MTRTAGPSSMNPKYDTGPANGTLIFSPPPRSALSGVSKDRSRNAAVPRNVSPMRVTCAAVSSIDLLTRSAEGLRRPRRLRPVTGDEPGLVAEPALVAFRVPFRLPFLRTSAIHHRRSVVPELNFVAVRGTVRS